MASSLILLGFLIAIFPSALASDTSPLQDFCVADFTSSVRVNGFTCKDPVSVQVNDFYLSGTHLPRITLNGLGINFTIVDVFAIAGLNTLGLSTIWANLAPGGLAPLHTHPRANEILIVVHGTVEVGFVTSSPDNRHITKVLHKGDVFVFPTHLVHYQQNIGNDDVVTIAVFDSQFPGISYVGNTAFGSKQAISDDVLAKSFKTDTITIESIRSKF